MAAAEDLTSKALPIVRKNDETPGSMVAAPSPFRNLPPEIWGEICSKMRGSSSIYQMRKVSKNMNRSALPHVYKFITLHNRLISKLLSHPDTLKIQQDIKKYCQHLTVHSDLKMTRYQHLILELINRHKLESFGWVVPPKQWLVDNRDHAIPHSGGLPDQHYGMYQLGKPIRFTDPFPKTFENALRQAKHTKLLGNLDVEVKCHTHGDYDLVFSTLSPDLLSSFKCLHITNDSDNEKLMKLLLFLKRMVNLRSLSLSTFGQRNSSCRRLLPAGYGRVPPVKFLSLLGYDWPLAKGYFESVWDFTNLTHLELHGVPMDAFFARVPFTELRKLQVFIFSDKLWGVALVPLGIVSDVKKDLWPQLELLEKLSIGSNFRKYLSPASVPLLSHHLRELDLCERWLHKDLAAKAGHLNSDGLNIIHSHCPHLRSLGLELNMNLPMSEANKNLRAICQFKNLIHLKIRLRAQERGPIRYDSNYTNFDVSFYGALNCSAICEYLKKKKFGLPWNVIKLVEIIRNQWSSALKYERGPPERTRELRNADDDTDFIMISQVWDLME